MNLQTTDRDELDTALLERDDFEERLAVAVGIGLLFAALSLLSGTWLLMQAPAAVAVLYLLTKAVPQRELNHTDPA